MSYFMVSYDLREGQAYDDIIAELRRIGAVRYQESAWLVEQDVTDVQLLNALKTYLPVESEDKLMVIEFFSKPKCNRSFKSAIDWIAARFPTQKK
jgi:virulence-associated protein VapD